MILFLDTEFTGLDHRWPRLISIGLVSEDGAQCFYAETPKESYLEKCNAWVLGNVLPLLIGGKYIMTPQELGERLAAWLVDLGEVVIVCDAPQFDFAFLRATLRPWPRNVDITPVCFGKYTLESSGVDLLANMDGLLGPAGHKAHHALNDANDLRNYWLAAKRLDAFQPFVERLARVHPHPDLQALVSQP